MNFSQKILSQTITQLCLVKGIDHIVISPGSRNAPLTIGFTEHPDFKNFSIVDERCAAFFALGLAQQLQKPVALVCTSGSAVLNYYPAIAEAFYSDIPLVVISADRPSELLEMGDGQTILQENVFSNHILYSANCVEGEAHQTFNETEINIALNTAFELQGPVHINVPFSEPLYLTVPDLQVRPQHVPVRRSTNVLTEDLQPFIKEWNTSSRKIILAGVLSPNSLEEKMLATLAQDESVVVFTETTSNLHHTNFIHAIDQLIAPLDANGFTALQPDILLTFGGMVVSKKVKAFLRSYPPKTHWHVDPKKAYDTYFVLKHHFKTTPSTFLKAFLPEAQVVSSTFQKEWLTVKSYRLSRHEAYLDEVAFSDFKVFAGLCEALPKKSILQLANSATIRYTQLFKIDASIEVFCNRGTSGIDGSTSTAIGAAFASDKQVVFVTGDLAFFYDSNALWNNYIPNNFRIIVVNNSGGGIFRILPGAKNTAHFDTYFETKHHLSAKHLSEMYGFEYLSAKNEKEVENELNEFFKASETPKVLEVFTPSEVNDAVLTAYFQYLK
ncbi:2-succinyl-5-enolpyruvyl-6-hydroxy-3-cyclohexene-1-carboxylate synthase [Ulvibacter sp. MAR_2010_11]|uniref:2-succinyl-5-enolpyruvyl-6-hydroxy-3- cyclohexene-1-carboxylic-acid synthase n=1 Tax=Ulvibacter sp. MAR_2010_11 TaxID=1250229 RepID=UPI000C2C667A|nr:2-succinyl-5-enolpyruvyl-6-hydroxy-3-cyclohexene-1-carboxylic-acid synthase [Ulvibacter sp. MAR_2010_11]PKA84397.1 2-succinyl-5-enolpyruvyl-6-hydroxy-3-cyclohexene-1-carboxylate synthase [Ulvibacter sp. MAR_2010_11]